MPSSYAYTPASSSSNGHAKKPSISTEHFRGKLGDLLGAKSEEELPLYKDKPHHLVKQKGLVSRLIPRRLRKRWVILGATVLFIWWFASSVTSWLGEKQVQWTVRRDMVRDVFITSWEDYAKSAWGKDEYSPISHRSKFLVSGKSAGDSAAAGAGWIIVDGLDTAILMNCTRQVTQARKWIHTSLDFGKLDGNVSTFETTVRVLGGLLSAHYLSSTFPNLAAQRDDDRGQKGEDLYIEKAVDLAERLLGAFDTATGIPFPSVNLNTSRGIAHSGRAGSSSTPEAATPQLELKYIAKLTGEPLYWTVAEKAMETIDAPRFKDGLLPPNIESKAGSSKSQTIRLGSRGDSYYEYLVKQYLQTGESIYKEMWDEALDGIKRHLITWSHHSDFTVLAERPNGLEGGWSGKMDHRTCFLPGTIALGVTGGLSVVEAKKALGSLWTHKQEEDLVLAEELMKTCWGMYLMAPTGLAPETTHLTIDDPPRRWNFDDTWRQPRSLIDFDDAQNTAYKNKAAPWRSDYDIHPSDAYNLQRPETVESLYYLWRITGKEVYREWGWQIFAAFSQNSKVVNALGRVSGYTCLDSVMDVPPKHLDNLVAGTNIANRLVFERDNMEGHWLSETLKYLYLLFSEDVSDEWFDLNKIVVSTQAHFFPRFDISRNNAFKTGWTRKEESAPSTKSEQQDSTR